MAARLNLFARRPCPTSYAQDPVHRIFRAFIWISVNVAKVIHLCKAPEDKRYCLVGWVVWDDVGGGVAACGFAFPLRLHYFLGILLCTPRNTSGYRDVGGAQNSCCNNVADAAVATSCVCFLTVS